MRGRWEFFLSALAVAKGLCEYPTARRMPAGGRRFGSQPRWEDVPTVNMQVRFWGARGSTPTPNRENLRYGGNTPCLEFRTKSGKLFILDCGTGFRQLGHALLKRYGKKPINARVFISHYHWDHIQGIPFFQPLYSPKNRFIFHGYPFQAERVRASLEGQMADPYFPVDMSMMKARRHFIGMEEENRINFDDLTVTTKMLHHPQGCLGFRLECNGKVFTYASDNEPGNKMGDRNVRDLAEGADVFLYDAQFLPKEMKYRKGWGHSTWKEGVRIAKECKVKKLVLFHHDPDRSDKQLDEILKTARDHFDSVVAAKEGLTLTL